MIANVVILSAVVAVVSANPAPISKPSSCPEIKPFPVKDVEVFADSLICAPLPRGVCGDAIVANVSYTLPGTTYGCNCDAVTLWCEGNVVVDAKKNLAVSKYWYCCGDDCTGVPADRKCVVDGKEYKVGAAYNMGNGKTMWCVDEDTVVTCVGKECGSTLALTPPGVKSCPVPPVIVYPPPTVQCKRDWECDYEKGCELGCFCNRNGRCEPAHVYPPAKCDGVKCEYGYHCEEGKCVENKPIDPCRDVKCEYGYHCEEGKCVENKPVDPCRDVKCEYGYHCEEGECVENKPVDPCRDVKCEYGYHCEEGECVANDPCADFICGATEGGPNKVCIVNDDGEPECVIVNPCDGVKCEVGEHCEVVEGDSLCIADEPAEPATL